MIRRPTVPPGTTVYTDQLTGATLNELLDAAERDEWPEKTNTLNPEWDLLRNWAIQTESLKLDEAEDLAWEQTMRDLNHRDLPYHQWVADRMEALKDRVRARKLAQANLRYKYGYRGARSSRLIRRAVRDFHGEWAAE